MGNIFLKLSQALQAEGVVKLPAAFDQSLVDDVRELVLRHAALFKNTRPHPRSGHLAGFHRYPQLEPLHHRLSAHRDVTALLQLMGEPSLFRTIGLSDITINRSQPWHTDLLRGVYSHFIDPSMCWGSAGGGVVKILLYLQAGRSLQYIPGSHHLPRCLDADDEDELLAGATPVAVEVSSGDLLVMDIRLVHRGSSDQDVEAQAPDSPEKILVSTVLGRRDRPLTSALERGNLQRLHDWEARHQTAPPPCLMAGAAVGFNSDPLPRS